MTGAAEGLLRAHAACVADAGALPPEIRDDVAGELYSHLLERWHEHVAAGLDEETAARAAIADLGAADQLGHDFRRTYHGRLWAATIGLLLPMGPPRGERPQIITWVVVALWALIAFDLLGLAAAVTTLSPVRLAIDAIALSLNGALLMAAARAAFRGSTLALKYAGAQLALIVALGFGQISHAASPTISVSAIAAGLLLVGLSNGWSRILAWAPNRGRSATPGRASATALAAIAAFAAGLPLVASALPDPTQASSGDVSMIVTTSCDSGSPEFPLEPGAAESIVTMDLTPRKVDLAPRGLDELDRRALLDVAGIAVGPTGFAGLMQFDGALLDSRLTDLTAGLALNEGRWAEDETTVRFFPGDDLPWRISMSGDQQQAGHQYRFVWRVVRPSGSDRYSGEVVVRYAHLDRFALQARLPTCDGHAVGAVVGTPGVSGPPG